MTRPRVLKGVLLIVVIIVPVELASFLAYLVIYRHPFSYRDVIAARSRVLEDPRAEDGLRVGGVALPFDVDIHPYYRALGPRRVQVSLSFSF